MKKYLIVLTISLGIVSCAPKKENIIAIDVLLIPSEEMYAQAIQLNALIKKNNSETITLDEKQVPHITLLQCFINESDLPKVEEALKGLFNTIKDETLRANLFHYSEDKTESFASITIYKSKPLLELHKKTITLLKPFMIPNGTQESYVQNPDGMPIDQFTIGYVPKFVNNHSYENYDPHISLGVAKTELLDSLYENYFHPMKFRATSISVYQLGAFGTAQKLLWKSE